MHRPMKPYFFCFVLMLSLRIAAQDTLHVLFLGNSYTAYNNLPGLVQNLSQSAGKTLIYESNTPGGYTISGHLQDSNSIQKIRKGTWDYIIIQEQSQVPTIPYYRDNDMYPALGQLQQLAQQYHPCTKLITYMTWGRRFGGQQCDPGNVHCSPNFKDFNEMQDALAAAYQHISDSLLIQCAPVGMVWKSILSDTNLVLHTGDQSHPALEGSYIAALTIYSSLWKKSCWGLPYTAGLDTTLANYFQQHTAKIQFNSGYDWNLYINQPHAAFTDSIYGYTVQFNNTSKSLTRDSLTYGWDFGDGQTSNLKNPHHNYSGGGSYEVRLVVSSCQFSDTVRQSISIGANGLAPISSHKVSLYPNPGNDYIHVSGISENIPYTLSDLQGRMIMKGMLTGKDCILDISNLPKGIYLLQLSEFYKIIKE